MESRFRLLFLSAVLIAGPAAAIDGDAAQEPVIAPDIERRAIEVPHIDSEDFEVGLYGGVMSVEDFGANPVIGARLAYHVTEDVFVEAAYGQTDTDKTSYELLSGSAELLTHTERRLRYYNVSFGYNLLPGEAFLGRKRAMPAALYLIGGVGSTRFAGDDRFTVNIGAGYRLLATDTMAIRLDVRDHMFDIDLLGEKKTAHNIEAHAGVSFFF